MFKQITDDKFIKLLTDYAKSLNKTLYVVGGVVRDILLNQKRQGFIDVDLTSNLNLEQLKIFATKFGVKCEVKNKKLEVVAFLYENKIYEHARMRTEIYADKTSHNPSEVFFTDSVEEDVKRRDFTINSIYYATHNSTIIDPVLGVEDIRKQIVQTVLNPKQTLSVDPTRILRMIELVARFDLALEEKTKQMAYIFANNVLKLSKSRLKKEVNRLLFSPKYGENKESYINKVKKLLAEFKIECVLE